MGILKLLPIDKDGTLVETISGETFINKPWDQRPISGVREALAKYAVDGWTIVIISNQAGVAAGHKSLESMIAEMQFCLELFPGIKEAYFCPDFEERDCWRVWGDCSEQYRILYGSGWTTLEGQISAIPQTRPWNVIDLDDSINHRHKLRLNVARMKSYIFPTNSVLTLSSAISPAPLFRLP